VTKVIKKGVTAQRRNGAMAYYKGVVTLIFDLPLCRYAIVPLCHFNYICEIFIEGKWTQ